MVKYGRRVEIFTRQPAGLAASILGGYVCKGMLIVGLWQLWIIHLHFLYLMTIYNANRELFSSLSSQLLEPDTVMSGTAPTLIPPPTEVNDTHKVYSIAIGCAVMCGFTTLVVLGRLLFRWKTNTLGLDDYAFVPAIVSTIFPPV